MMLVMVCIGDGALLCWCIGVQWCVLVCVSMYVLLCVDIC